MSTVQVFVVFSCCIALVFSFTGTQQCGENEIPPTDKNAKIGKMIVRNEKCEQVSTLACDSCKDCSSCFCEFGFIRSTAGGECITHTACQKLHVQWLAERKRTGKNYFCKYEP